MSTITKKLAVAGLACAGLSACISSTSTADDPMSTAGEAAKNSQSLLPAPAATAALVTPKMAEAMAFDALRRHLNDDRTPITLLKNNAINWPDASIGCPKPGFNYPMVIIPGYQLTLKSGGQSYDVHVAKKRAVVCTKSIPGIGQKPRKTLKAGALVVENLSSLAKADLAGKIVVDQQDIRVISTEPATWPSNSLGCDEQKRPPNSKGVDGYRITLESKGRRYTYHSDKNNRVLACPKIEAF